MRAFAQRISITLLLATSALLCDAAAATALEPPIHDNFALSASPQSISWPDSSKFEYRLQVTAGPEGINTDIRFPGGWGINGVDGSPFRVTNPRLEGPGELIQNPIAIPMLYQPGRCVRGTDFAGWFTLNLRLSPGEETTLVADGELSAAPLPGMTDFIRVNLRPKGAETNYNLDALIFITGRPGVLVRTEFAGAKGASLISREPRQSFRLRGSTQPILANRKIVISVEGRDFDRGTNRSIRRFKVVKTDAKGRFRSGKLRLKRPGEWRLSTTLARPGSFDNAPGCAGVVRVHRPWRSPSVARLSGHGFTSTWVWGRKLGRQKVRLDFIKVPKGGQPILAARVGCNWMSARYRIRNGRLRWTGPVSSTKMACKGGHDRWLAGLLRRGMKVEIRGKTLALKRRQTEIILERDD